jgi:hypothetical protein
MNNYLVKMEKIIRIPKAQENSKIIKPEMIACTPFIVVLDV